MECPQNTSVITDNTPLECNEYLFSSCIINIAALPFISQPANSLQKDINSSIVNTLITQNASINLLQQGGFINEDLEINGTYNLSSIDDKKYYNVTSITNTPRIALDAALPDGFECYMVNNTPILDGGSLVDLLVIETEFTTPPLFTVPRAVLAPSAEMEDVVQNYGIIHIKKQSNNLYTVNGDLMYFPS